MPKRSAALFLLLFTSYILVGQIVNRSYDSKDFQAFLNAELNVVLTGKEPYDENIKKALEKYWEIGTYKFITKKQALYDIKDETKSFLVPMKVREYKETNTNGVKSYESTDRYKFWITIILGGKSKLSKYNDNDVIALSPLNMWSGEKRPEDAGFRMDYIIKGLNDGLAIVIDNKMSEGRMKMYNTLIDEINKNASVIKDKTLIVNKDALFVYKTPVNTIREDVYKDKIFEKNYPYKYEFVSEDEYLEILEGNSEEELVLITIIEVNTHFLIYDPSTRKTVYYGWEMSGRKLGKGDIKDMIEYKK